MSEVARNGANERGDPHHVAQALADWWMRPDSERVVFWGSAAYEENVILLWQDIMGGAGVQPVRNLLSAAISEGRELPTEYERLFVGPAAIPCPPYEAVWRKDRPKHEQGTVMGQSTTEVIRIYRDLGLRLHPDQMELADHVAIELEALAFAWASAADAELARRLFQRLQLWLPDFCASVIENSDVEFYRVLARITEQCFAGESPLASSKDRERGNTAAQQKSVKANNNLKAAESGLGKD